MIKECEHCNLYDICLSLAAGAGRVPEDDDFIYQLVLPLFDSELQL